MDLFEAKRIAEDYYNKIVNSSVVSGQHKLIAVKGKEALEISDPSLAQGCYKFEIQRRNGNNYIVAT